MNIALYNSYCELNLMQTFIYLFFFHECKIIYSCQRWKWFHKRNQHYASQLALFFAVRAGLVPCWKPHFIPWSHYCLRLRCPHSPWFVGNELAPPCPCSIILIEKVIFHSTEQIGDGESMSSNQELTCSWPAEKLTTARSMLSRRSRWGIKSDERDEDQKQDSVRPHLVLKINKNTFSYAVLTAHHDPYFPPYVF